VAAPYGPPAARPRRRGGIVGPLVLIFIGVVLLLQNAGFLPPNAWLNLWKLWPLVLVLAGMELLLANRIPWLVLAGLAAVILLLGVVASAVLLPSTALGNPSITRASDIDLGGANQAAVTLRFGAGQLNVGALMQPAGGQLATIHYSGPAGLAPEPRYTVSDGTGRLELQSAGGRGGVPFGPLAPLFGERAAGAEMDVQLAPVPIQSMIVQTGATDAHIDLSALQINSLDVSVGAASAWIRVPEHGTTNVHLSGGASSVRLEIPANVAAQIRHRGGLSAFNVNQSRFPAVADDTYRSQNYADAQDRVDITLETGVTSVNIN
jgi:Domain of unknown function (DUF5668)